jgi:hypothetical protein
LQVVAFLGHTVHELVAVTFITADVVAVETEAPEMGQEFAD